MNFIDAVKGLDEVMIFRRDGWDQNFGDDYKRLIKDEYGVLKTISMTYVNEYEANDEDVLADDWSEIEKEKYLLTEVFIKNGIQHFTIAMTVTPLITKTFRRFEFKQMMNHLDISFDEKYKEEIDKLLNPTIPPFDYNFRRCAVCDSSISFDYANDGKCPTGCLEYGVDPQGEDVSVTLFNSEFEEEHFFVSLYPNGWNGNDHKMKVDLKKFQEAVLYWHENERYKERIK